MKRIFFIITISACWLTNQAQWIPQSSGTNSDLLSVCFTNNNNGWAVGSEGIVLHTDNGGETWTEQTIGTDHELTGVCFIDTLTGWISGRVGNHDGIILRTENGGNTWNQVYQDTSCYLTDIHSSDSLNVWAVGRGTIFYAVWGKIFHSADGGESWEEQYWGDALLGVHFIDSVNGWVAGGCTFPSTGYVLSLIMNTIDGGTTWTNQMYCFVPPGTDSLTPLTDIYFIDAEQGWAVGPEDIYVVSPPCILHTTNGGISWEEQFSGITDHWSSVHFTDESNGWIIGGSTIIHTVDGGITWEEQQSGITEGLSDICFVDSITGWIVGGNGTILHTTNGGIVGITNNDNRFNKINIYPNPISNSTNFEYEVRKFTQVSLFVYNTFGQQIETLVNDYKQPGQHQITWNPEGLPSGIYFYRLTTGSQSSTGKLVVVR